MAATGTSNSKIMLERLLRKHTNAVEEWEGTHENSTHKQYA